MGKLVAGSKDSGISNSLLVRIASSLEENGSALKTARAENMQMNVNLAQLTTNFESFSNSVNTRLDRLERKIEGNGGPGLKTNVALLTQRVDDIENDVLSLEKSKKINAEKKINTLETQKREDKNFRLTLILAVAATLISLTSSLGNCAPNIINAFSEPSAKTTGKTP